jgi:hypothetical protein
MNAMQVAIKYVNFPSAASSGKYGSITDQNGMKIMVPVDLLPQFRSGMVCEIATRTQTWGQGTDREAQVTVATSGPQGGQRSQVAYQGGQVGYQRPGQGQGYQRPNTGFQPRVVQNGPVGVPPGTDQARYIFVTGVVGRAMGSGKFTASEIMVLTVEANAAFDRLKAPPRPEPVEALQTSYNQGTQAILHPGGGIDPNQVYDPGASEPETR